MSAERVSASTHETGSSSKELTNSGPSDQKVPAAQVTFPEGSVPGWMAVCGGALVGFCSFGNCQSFGVYQDFYTRYYFTGNTPSQISWIGSVQLCLYYVLGLPAGNLFDEGYFHYLMGIGSFLVVFSSFMLSLVEPHQYYQAFLAQGVGMGMGMGLIFLPSISLLGHYFRARRSMAMGIVVTAGGFGAVAFTIILNHVFYKSNLGFGWGVRIISFINLACLLTANLIMKPRLPSRKGSFAKFRNVWAQIQADTSFWILQAGFFLVFWGLFVPFFYLQLFSKLRGVSPGLLIWTLPIMNAGSIPGRFLPSILADKVGPLNVLIPLAAACGGLLWTLLAVSDMHGLVAFGVFYGFFSGGFLSISPSAAASFTSSPTLDDLGLRIGIGCFVVGIALLTGNPIAGALLSPPKFLWWRPLTFSSVAILSGMFLILIARQGRAKLKGVARV